MDLELTGRHVLVTGGSRGIGLACAQAFLREGAQVSIVGRNPQHLEDAEHTLRQVPGARVAGFCADLRDAAAALAMVEAVESRVGPIDVLVNSAGAALRTPFAELEPAAWQAAMQAKFFTYVHVMDPVVKRMGARGRGAIVNVVGMGGKVPSRTHLAGGAANAALMLASAGLAAAYGPQGVRINAVNPSSTLTDRLAQGMAAEARLRQLSAQEVLRQATAQVPLGRLAAPQEVADLVLFLCSPRAAYVSGAIVAIDGASSPMVV